jgi:hypothetical protein
MAMTSKTPDLLPDGCAVAYAAIMLPLVASSVIYIWWYRDDYIAGTQRAADYWPIIARVLWFEMRAAGVLLISTGALCFMAVGWARLTKTRPRIFLSYHHSHYQQILPFAAALRTAKLEPSFVNFSDSYEHDRLLDDIYDRVKQADFFICFPGLEPSFVEAEIAAAISARKPIFIMLSQHNRGAPNTSHKSYPALMLETLQSENYKSLKAFIAYLYGNWWSTAKLFCDVSDFKQTQLAIVGIPFMIVFVLLVVVLFFGAITLRVAEFISFFISLSSWSMLTIKETYFATILFALIPSLFLFCAIFAIIGGIVARWGARLIVRRKITRGTYSLHSLKETLGDDERFLAAFWPEPPPAHHEFKSPGQPGHRPKNPD